MTERLVLPQISEASLNRYLILRNAPLNAMRNGVLPNIEMALVAYQELAESLTDLNGGGYEDGDQQLLAEYHPASIALVAPAINQLIEHMQAIKMIAQNVDNAFIGQGRNPLFGV